MFLIPLAAAYIGEWIQRFKDFPPRQKPGSFDLGRVTDSIMGGVQQ